MKLQNLRFQKFDKFEHPIFIASNTPEELENHTTLKDLAERLIEKQYDTFLPIYNSEEFNYSSIRFMKNSKHSNLVPNARYDIEYSVRTVTKTDRIFVNCHASFIKMKKNAPVEDIGEELDF
jgi:hypothetical protein